MVYLWQHNLPDILRADPVLAPKVIEWPGWRDRGRPPENFSFAPSGHISHHTGCAVRFNSHDPTGCINFIIAGNSATGVPGPISQYLGTVVKPGTRYDGTNLDPHIVVIAAGRANHAGGGKYNWGAPEGNGSSIAGEWCGPFDRWPDEYVEFRRRCLAAILRGNDWPINRDMTHQEYASFDDGRKIDPSAAWLREPGLGLTTAWNPNLWRGYVNELLQPPPPPPPPPPIPDLEEDMTWRVAKQLHDGPWFIGDGKDAFTVGDNGHDINSAEAAIRMATGAVNVARFVVDSSATGAGPKIVRTFAEVTRPIRRSLIRQYVGQHPSLDPVLD